MAARQEQVAKLREFYATQGVEKTQAQVEAAVDHYAGNWDQMWAELRKRYGDRQSEAGSSPAVAGGATPGNAGERAQWKKRIEAYFRSKGIERTDEQIEGALDQHEGRWADLYKQLREKYDKPQSAVDDEATPAATERDRQYWKDKITQYLKEKGIKRTDEEIDRSLAKHEPNWDQLWEGLQAKYGASDSPDAPQPSGPRDSQGLGVEYWRKRLRRYYTAKGMNKKDSDIEKSLRRFDGRWEAMWTALIRKYGPDPDEGNVITTGAHGPVAAEPSRPMEMPHPSDGSPQARDYSFSPHREPGKQALHIGTVKTYDDTFDTMPLAGYGVANAVMRCLLRILGADYGHYERADAERRHILRSAIEKEFADNLRLEHDQVRVTRLAAGSLIVEVAVDVPVGAEQELGEAVVRRVQSGTFTTSNIRDAYRQLGGNPMQLHVDGAAVLGGPCTPDFADGGVPNSAPMAPTVATNAMYAPAAVGRMESAGTVSSSPLKNSTSLARAGTYNAGSTPQYASQAQYGRQQSSAQEDQLYSRYSAQPVENSSFLTAHRATEGKTESFLNNLWGAGSAEANPSTRANYASSTGRTHSSQYGPLETNPGTTTTTGSVQRDSMYSAAPYGASGTPQHLSRGGSHEPRQASQQQGGSSGAMFYGRRPPSLPA